MAWVELFQYVETIAVEGCLADAVVSISCGVVTAMDEHSWSRQAPAMLCYGLTHLYGFWWLSQSRNLKHFNIHMIVYGVCFWIQWLVARLTFDEERGVEVIGTIMLAAGTLITLERFRALHTAQQFIKGHLEEYGKVWVAEKVRGRESLKKLKNLCEECEQRVVDGDSASRQYNRSTDKDDGNTSRLFSIFKVLGSSRPNTPERASSSWSRSVDKLSQSFTSISGKRTSSSLKISGTCSSHSLNAQNSSRRSSKPSSSFNSQGQCDRDEDFWYGCEAVRQVKQPRSRPHAV